jgi:hypothetical protein
MSARRFLLVTAALSATAAIEGCGKDSVPVPEPDRDLVNMPANPKGSHYDEGLNTPPPPPPPPPPPEVRDAGRIVRPLPANPKGSHYDGGMRTTTKKSDLEF